MQGPKFLYILLNKAGQSAALVNNTLVWNSILTPLEFTPDGWQEMSILTERNKASFGLDVTYGTPSNFVKSAAGILKRIAYLSNIEFETYLQILEQQLWFDSMTYGYYYAQLCKTEVDLSSYVDSGVVNATLMDGGLTKYLKANKGTEYAIDIDVPDRKQILMDGTTLKESAQFIIQDPFDINFRAVGNHIIGLNLTTQEQKSTIGAKSTTRLEIDQSNHAGILASNDYVYATQGESVVTATFDFAVTVQRYPGSDVPILPAARLNIGFLVLDQAGNLINYPGGENILYDSGPGFGSAFNHHIVKVTKSFTVPAGCFVYPRCSVNITNDSYAGSIQFLYDNDSTAPGTPNVDLKYNYKFKPTICYGLTLRYMLDQLVNKMTGGRYGAQSDLLDNPDLNVVLTCGDSLRQLAGAQIKISYDKFWTIVNLIHGTGYGNINSKLRVERKRFWVAPDDPGVELGPAGTGFKLRPYLDCMFSSIKFGYPNQSYDTALGDINGRYEFNVTQIMTTDVTRVSTALDLTTTVRADMYGAEFARINLDGKTSTSDNSDNDVWALHVTKTKDLFTQSLLLDRSINQYVQDTNVFVKAGDTYNGVLVLTDQYVKVGLLDKASAFNVALSPKQCLLRSHGDYLHSCFDNMENSWLRFSKSDKNSALVITGQPGGVDTDENGDVQVATLKPRIFKPWVFEAPIDNPPSISAAIASNPVRKYNTSYAGIPISGTALKSAIAPTDNAIQAYQLLLGPNVDITPFIDVYE